MPPSDEEIRNLLLKYIAGETDEEEVAFVEKWLGNHPEAFQEFEQLWDLWYAVGTATNVFRFNVDEGWNETLLMIRESKIGHKRKRSFKKIIVWGSSAAATLLLFLGFVFWQEHNKTVDHSLVQPANNTFLTHSKNNRDTTYIRPYDTKIQTPLGKKRKVKLPDGSIVWMNGGTLIHFHMDQKQGARTLYLRGQAFFNIAHESDMPFVVNMEHATIKVLGTRFNVSAYPEDSTVEATLTSGRILFKTTANNQTIKRQIQPGQQIAINYLSGRVEVSIVDTTFYTSWKEGKLIFNNQSFKEVARAMEHKYNIKIIFNSPDLQYKKLNGYLQKETLDEALTALKLTLQFDYKIKGNKVFIYQ